MSHTATTNSTRSHPGTKRRNTPEQAALETPGSSEKTGSEAFVFRVAAITVGRESYTRALDPKRTHSSSTMTAPMIEPMMPEGWKNPLWASLWKIR